jgi:hypothetical protein
MPVDGGVLPKTTTRVTLLLWASLQSGCFLLGYDELGNTLDNDAATSESGGDAGAIGTLRDGSLGNGGSDSGDASGDGDALDGGDSDSGSNGTGSDGGATAEWWKDVEPTVPCKGLIGTAACSQNCTAAAGQCVFDCNVLGSCGTTCQAYTSCRSTCSSVASCGFTCGESAQCSFDSTSVQVSATCEVGSTCDVTCPDNSLLCDVTCKPGAICALHCTGICNMNCSGVKRQCQDKSWVCDTKCPEDLP